MGESATPFPSNSIFYSSDALDTEGWLRRPEFEESLPLKNLGDDKPKMIKLINPPIAQLEERGIVMRQQHPELPRSPVRSGLGGTSFCPFWTRF